MADGSHYDKEAADYAVGFIECLCHTKGTWAKKPFELIDWQEQIIRDIFGTLKPNGYRQFNTAYIEIPKKQGKSELAAAVALLLTCGDGEERAEVYGCAADRQQASIVFNVAADMVRMCPALSKRVKILDSQKRLIYLPTGSIYQVLSADVGNKHGFNTHGVVFDELHTQPNRKLFDVMTKGSGDARMQPSISSSPPLATTQSPSAMRYTRRPRTSLRAGKLITHSIRLSMERMNPTTGQTQKLGRRPTLPLESQLALTRSEMPVNPPSRIPAKRMRFGSSA